MLHAHVLYATRFLLDGNDHDVQEWPCWLTPTLGGSGWWLPITVLVRTMWSHLCETKHKLESSRKWCYPVKIYQLPHFATEFQPERSMRSHDVTVRLNMEAASALIWHHHLHKKIYWLAPNISTIYSEYSASVRLSTSNGVKYSDSLNSVIWLKLHVPNGPRQIVLPFNWIPLSRT